MRAPEWEIIQKNIDDLMGVKADEIKGSLYEDDVLDLQDLEEINAEKANNKKMELLLAKLKYKDNAFNALVKSLRKNGTYTHIADEMEQTEATANPNLFAKGDPRVFERQVTKVLMENYTNQPGKTKLCDVMETVKKHVKGGFDWNNKLLSQVICKVFVNAKVENSKSVGCKKKSKFIMNLIPLITSKSCSSSNNASTLYSDNVSYQEFLNFDPENLKAYLEQLFLQKKQPTNLPQILFEAMVTGEVLLSSTEEEIQKLTQAPFGILKTLTLKISEIKQHSESETRSQKKNESLRKFDSEVDSSLSYQSNYYVDISNKIDCKLTPLRNFYFIEFQENIDLALEELGSKTIQFISACVNDRQNGTIYFGIDPDSGKIIGIEVSKEKVQEIITYFILSCFPEETEAKLQSVMRIPVFIPVKEAGKTSQKFVIEIDIVPSYRCFGENPITPKLKKLKACSNSETKCRKVGHFHFLNGKPELFKVNNLANFQELVSKAQKQRQEDEENIFSPTPENLRKKLLNLLTGGREILEDSIYPFFILSPLDPANSTTCINHVQFISNLQAEVVFDFDPTGSTQGVFSYFDQTQGEVMTVVTLENFRTHKNSKEYTTFIESLSSDSKLPWVFCNGYEPMLFKETCPTDWNKHIRSAFQKCLQQFAEGRPKDRILVIVCLFSKNYETMLEGFDEMLTHFSKQWVLYAESENISDMWQKEVIHRKKLTEQDVKERCVVGMTWEQINTTILQATQRGEIGGCMIPQAAGSLINVNDKKLKCWYDVELVSAADPVIDEKNDESKKVMASFYKGEAVDWLNFWLEGQVIKRTHDPVILEKVKQALTEKTKDDEKISTVVLFHHPGSGATTSAKKVLWELRKDFRCCVLRSISEKTCSQLVEIWRFSEPISSPLPLLILVDNEEEEKYRQLKQNLEEKFQSMSKKSKEQSKIFCTMLVCIRKATLPLQVMRWQMLLEQKLTSQEQELFKTKHIEISSAFEKNKKNDPKYLISFNILKNDFKIEYVANVVKEFVDDINDERELTLLTYIALLNKYDPQFRAIPVSCFDAVFKKSQDTVTIRRSTNWEANLSEAAQVLLNISSLHKKKAGGARISVRVHHKLIATNILDYLKKKNVSEKATMKQLIDSVVFERETSDIHKLENIIGDIMQKRDFNKVDGKKEMFSPFITQVNQDDEEEDSLRLLCLLFEKNKDPFTAQQICRFYIHLKNWTRAEKYAEIATNKQPRNTFFWDTYGQVYKSQLQEKLNLSKSMAKNSKFPISEIEHVIELARKAIFYFKKEQKECELYLSQGNENYVAGYFGELKTQKMLLNLLEKNEAFNDQSFLSSCLIKKCFDDPCFKILKPQDIEFLKNLEENYTQAMRVLDEQYLQIRDEVPFDYANYSGKFGRDIESLVSLMNSFHEYYGAAFDKATIDNLQEPMASMYRWRVVLKYGGMSLNYLLKCRADCNPEDVTSYKQYVTLLLRIYNLMLPNVKSYPTHFKYLLAILNAVTMLIMVGSSVTRKKTFSFEKVLEWSTKLFEYKQPSDKTSCLEPYMYFVMYNFPSNERKQHNICSVKKLQDACTKWQDIYRIKFPKSEAKTLFYLAKGGLLNDLVHSDTFPMTGRDNWDNPEMREHLALYKGVVDVGGKQVNINITTKDGNNFTLSVLTSYTVSNNLWQKETYFFIGFSFSGPKAYGIPQDPPGK